MNKIYYIVGFLVTWWFIALAIIIYGYLLFLISSNFIKDLIRKF